MKKFLKVLATALFLSVSAFAQLGLNSTQAPGQNNIWVGGVYWVCATTTSIATCKSASDVSIFTDAAGASQITQTSAGTAIPTNGTITFYSQPGLYQIVYLYTNASIGTFSRLFTVAPNVAGNVALNDGYFIVTPGACAVKASASAGATNSTLVAVGASFTPAIEGNTTAAATQTVSCLINVPTRLTVGKGITIQNVVLEYGVVTTAFTSTTAPILSTITFPASGTSETPSTITPVAAPGTLTVLPVIGSANLTAQTAGAFYTEKVTLNTPLSVNTDLVNVLFQQGFVQSAGATSLLDVTGLIVHYSINQI